MEIAIATPMVLTFVSFAGMPTVIAVTSLLLLVMGIVKWGKQSGVNTKRKAQVVGVSR